MGARGTRNESNNTTRLIFVIKQAKYGKNNKSIIR